MALKRITPGITDTTLVTTVQKNYSDVDLSFAAKPGTFFDSDGRNRGDVYKKSDVNSVLQSCQNIVLTNRGEKPFDPEYGCDLRRLLFELNTTVSESQVSRMIRTSLENHEPRVEVLDVQLFYEGSAEQVPRGIDNIFFYKTGTTVDRYSLTVTVVLKILNTGQVVSTPINMNRLR